MPGLNITIKKEDGWVLVSDGTVEAAGTLVSNPNRDDCMFLNNPTKPAATMLGNILKYSEGFSVDDLPSEQLWFRTETAVTLVVTLPVSE